MPNRPPRLATADDYASGRAHPIGKTCADCASFGQFRGCRDLHGALAEDEVCQFEPKQFREPSVNGGMGLLKASLGERLKGGKRG